MGNDDRNIIQLPLKITYYIILILIIIFTILLLIVYIRDKDFHVNNINTPGNRLKLYICYFNIFFCSIVIIEDVLRLIPEYFGVDESDEENKANYVCIFQAVTSGFFDKLLLSNMTIYSIITSLGVFFSEFYKNHLKNIFIITISIGFLMSLALTIAYETEGIAYKDIVCSFHTTTSLRRITENIFTSLLFIINLICLVPLNIRLYNLKKQYEFEGKEEQLKKSIHFLRRYLFDLLINIIAFTYILLSVNKVFARGSYKDILYIVICLTVELFFTLNWTLYKAFIRLITCNKYYKESNNESNQDKGQDSEQGQYRQIDENEENLQQDETKNVFTKELETAQNEEQSGKD